MTLKQIGEGIKNSVIKDAEIEKKAAIKSAICDECEHSTVVKGWCSPRVEVVSEVTGQKVWRYGGCGCILHTLHRSSKPCTKGKF